ncbi:MAG TPA: SBBP repeat-containing protein [Bryobacteraceae bacterium]|nr:SBBP repeat-containing protein [Bryobacteraceae bacterium]
MSFRSHRRLWAWIAISLLAATAVAASPSLVAYNNLPLFFESNAGQTGHRAGFLARGPQHALFLGSEGASLRLHGQRGERVLAMKLVRANRAATGSGVDPLPGSSNYFSGNDPSKWRTGVAQFAKVRYRGVWPGVDIVYYGNQRTLEYDLVVAAGANPRAIQLEYQGADAVEIDPQGDLVLRLEGGEIRQHRPVVYQEVGGVRRPVEGSYVMKGRGRVGFQVAGYDATRPLVIDPVLTYSTYFGGGSSDQANAIAVDAARNVYIAGWTFSTDLPTANAVQPRAGSASLGYYNGDAFVAKIDPSGSTLLYCTYLGGAGDDVANAIAVDSSGNAYVTGRTSSADFPTMNAYQRAKGGVGANVFVAKLSPNGSSLIYSTFLGGDNYDVGMGIAVDAAGNAYVTGSTESKDFPVVNPIQGTLAGSSATSETCLCSDPSGSSSFWFCSCQDGFVSKLSPSGKNLIYSTYFGGSNDDCGNGIAVDAAGNAYVAGYTDTGGTTLSGTRRRSVFVTKVNPTGSQFAYSTTLSGSTASGVGGSAVANAIAVDAAGNAYVAGGLSWTGFQGTRAGTGGTCGYSDAFMTKLAPTGTVASTACFAGSAAAYGIALDAAGSAYLAGMASSSFPITKPSLQDTMRGASNDAFVAVLDNTGGLTYASFLGGSGGDQQANAIALDGSGGVYLAGHTTSKSFPVAQALKSAIGGTDDAFVAKIGFGAPGPSFTAAGVANVGSYLSGAVAPGEIVSIFGSNLGPSVGVPNAGYDPATGALPTALGNVSVSFDGQAAPLFFVRNDQINVQVPYEVAGKSATSIVVTYNGAPSAAVSVPVTAVSPGIFQYNGRTLVLNAVAGAIVDGGNPASRGDYVILFGTGPGLVDPPVPTGKPATASPYNLVRSPQAQIGGRVVPVAFAGMTPGFTGLMQINLQVPADAPTGSDVPLQLSVNGILAQAYLGGAPTAALTVALK